MEDKYIKTLGNLYYFLNYSIFFFNFMIVLSGSVLYSLNIKNIDYNNNSTIIINCDNVSIYNFVSLINAFLVLLTLTSLFEIQLVSFITNISISVLNYINLYHISQYCIDYYTNNHIYFWVYYLYNIFIQTITNMFYLLLICIAIRYICYKDKDKDKDNYKKLENNITNNITNEDYGSINKEPIIRYNLYDDIIDPGDLEYGE